MGRARGGFFLAVVLGAALPLQAQPPLTLTEPYLLALAPASEMNVCWIVSERVSSAYVEYGPTPAYGRGSTPFSTRSAA